VLTALLFLMAALVVSVAAVVVRFARSLGEERLPDCRYLMFRPAPRTKSLLIKDIRCG